MAAGTKKLGAAVTVLHRLHTGAQVRAVIESLCIHCLGTATQ
jgi:hypothetical protein